MNWKSQSHLIRSGIYPEIFFASKMLLTEETNDNSVVVGYTSLHVVTTVYAKLLFPLLISYS